MVQLYVRLTVAPERIQEITQALRAIMSRARADRECVSARVSIDVENPTVVSYAEDWLTAELMDREINSTRFTRLMEVMESSIAAPVVEFRFLTEVRGLEYADVKRQA